MGNSKSTEKNQIDNKGAQQITSNNITIEESVQIHNDIIIILLFIITTLLVLQFIVKIYKYQQKRILENNRNRNFLRSLANINIHAANDNNAEL